MPRVAARLVTFEAAGRTKPDLAEGEVFINTPFIGDGTFPDEMGQVEEYFVKVGDEVRADQTIAVVETHKASIDVRSPVSGKVSRILVEPDTPVFETHPIVALIDTTSPRVRYKLSDNFTKIK